MTHTGEEFVYVLEGEIEVHTELYAPFILRAGESVYLGSSMGHAYLAKSDRLCRIIGVCSASEMQFCEPAPTKPAPRKPAAAPRPRKRARSKKPR